MQPTVDSVADVRLRLGARRLLGNVRCRQQCNTLRTGGGGVKKLPQFRQLARLHVFYAVGMLKVFFCRVPQE